MVFICKRKQINFPKLGILILLTLLLATIGTYGISIALGNAVSGLTVNPDPIKLGSTAYINYTLSENAYTSINIYTETGQQVRTVLNSVYKYAGSNFQNWDGRDSNGVLVPDGNYRIVVEAKDSPAGTVIGQAEITRLAARLPGISLVSDSPDPFNPLLGQQATINYTLSGDALVTVTVLQGVTPVRTLTVNEFVYAGPRSIAWDGRDDSGNVVGDGAYTYQIDAVSPTVASFKSASRATSTVEKENPGITDFVVSPDPLKLASSSLSIRYSLSENSKVTLKIVDSTGNLKRTILNAVAKNSGLNSSTWDGRDDLGNYVPEGIYSVVVNAVDNFNNSSGDRTVSFKAGYQPALSTPAIVPNPFNPNDPVNGTATISYNISRDALVTVQILNGYTPVRTVINSQSQTAGNQVVQWDGKDDAGNIVGDGPYSYQITAVSPTVSTFSSTFKAGITVEKGPPGITQLSLSPDPYKLGSGNLFIGYNLSEPAPVDIKIYQGATLIRSLLTGQSKPAGYNSASWDGKDGAGNYVGEGIYTVVVSAVDNAGNYGEARGNVTAGYLPAISSVTHIPEPFNPANGGATINFTLSNSARVTVTILKGSMPVRTIAAGTFTAGSQSVIWDGKNDNNQFVADGSYSYQIDAASPTVDTFRSTVKGNITLEGSPPALTELSVTPTVVKIVYNATFRYNLSEGATVTTQILNAQTREVVRSFPAEAKNAGGYYSLNWDTKDNFGFYIAPGNYILKISAVDKANNSGAAELAFQAQAIPKITNAMAMPATVDLGSGQTSATIAYNISVDSYVTLKIFDSNNKPFKTVYAFKVVSGSDSVKVNVYENGQGPMGTLTYTIDASSVVGYFKAEQVTGTIQVVNTSQAPPPSNSGCNDCHTNYPVPHRMTNCAGCHSEDKPIQNCASCHPTWSHDYKVLNTYECSYCHNVTYSYKIPSHGDITTLHTTTLAVDCQKCHNPSLSVEHPLYKDPSGKPYDCNTCHQSTRPEVQQAIANKQKDCANCHTQTRGGHPHKVTTFESSPQVDCAACHTTDTTTNSTDLAQLHAARNITCAGCHNATFEDGIIINKGDGVVNVPNCSTCHDGTKAPAAGGKYPEHGGTGTSHMSATGFGTYNDPKSQGSDCTACHSSLAVSTVHGALTCNTCHTSSVAEVKTVINNNLSRVAPKPGFACADCHNSLPVTHAPEHQALNDIEVTDVTCSNCHSFNVGFNAAAATTSLHTKNNCATCHSSTTPSRVKLFVDSKAGLANPAYKCNDCHATLPVRHNKLHTANAYLSAGDASQCANCHNTLEVTVLHKTEAGQASNCDKCHATTVRADVAKVISDNLSTVPGRPGFTCDSCHPGVKDGGHKHPVTNYAASPAVSCAECHATDQVAKTTDLATLHSNKGFGCSACHNATYEGGTSPIIVKDRVVNVPACGACHTGVAPYAPKAETAYPNHDSLSTTNHSSASTYGTYPLAGNVDCAGCHPSKNIRPVHEAAQCDKCHTGTVQVVQDVIKGNWSRTATKTPYSCADCHNAVTNSTTTRHKPVHSVSSYTSAAGDAENCGSCHGTNVEQGHVNQKTYSTGVTMTCDTCHASADTKVSTTIVQQSRNATPAYNCDSCHTLHGDPNVVHNTTFVTNPTMNCVKCHQNRIDDEHISRKSPATGQLMTCDTCHRSTDSLVRGAINSNNTQCDACHLTRHTDVQSVHISSYFPDTTVDCAGCHTATKAEFTNTNNKALHAIPGTTSKATGGTYVSPWAKDSTMDCRKCHSATNGTYYGRLLVKPYTGNTGLDNTNTSGDLCFLCHDYQAYYPRGTKNTSTYSNFRKDTKNLHTVGGKHGTGCQACHSAKPHAQTTREHFIVLKGEVNAGTKAALTKFIHPSTGNYSKSNCSAGCDTDAHP